MTRYIDLCARCRFFDKYYEICRRYAPAKGRWPKVDPGDYCGDFERYGSREGEPIPDPYPD